MAVREVSRRLGPCERLSFSAEAAIDYTCGTAQCACRTTRG